MALRDHLASGTQKREAAQGPETDERVGRQGITQVRKQKAEKQAGRSGRLARSQAGRRAGTQAGRQADKHAAREAGRQAGCQAGR